MVLGKCTEEIAGDQADLLDCLAAKASERLNHPLYKQLDPGWLAHEFAICGWATFPDSDLKEFRPYFAWVSNIRAEDGSPLWQAARDISMGFFQLKPPDDFPLILSGQTLEAEHERELREDIANTRGNLTRIADLLIHHVRRAADHNDAIGKGLLLNILPRTAESSRELWCNGPAGTSLIPPGPPPRFRPPRPGPRGPGRSTPWRGSRGSAATRRSARSAGLRRGG